MHYLITISVHITVSVVLKVTATDLGKWIDLVNKGSQTNDALCLNTFYLWIKVGICANTGNQENISH